MLENKVGDKGLSARDAAKLMEELRSFRTRIRQVCINLSTDDRKRLLHPRRGAETQMLRTNELTAKYELKVAGVSSEGQANDLELASTLRPVADELRAISMMVDDTVGRAESEAWETFLAQYAVLSSMATRIPELASELQPVVNFMAVGRHKKEDDPTNEPK